MKKMNLQTGKRTPRQGGFAMTELLLTIGIIALVLSAIAAIAITTSAGQTAQSEARLINSAASKIRNIYASRPDFGDLDLEASVKMEAWPTNMVTDGGDVYNAWGGEVDVAYPVSEGYSNQNPDRLFRIQTANVSQDACADLASAQTSALAVEIGDESATADANNAGTAIYERGSDTLDPLVATGPNGITGLCVDGVTVSFIFGKNG